MSSHTSSEQPAYQTNDEDGHQYPSLFTNGDVVILVSMPGVGMVVHAEDEEDKWAIGVFSTDWDMGDLVPYTGTITLGASDNNEIIPQVLQ